MRNEVLLILICVMLIMTVLIIIIIGATRSLKVTRQLGAGRRAVMLCMY